MGRNGQILLIDLSAQTYRQEPLPRDETDLFLGGRGLGAYLLARYLPIGTDPFDPTNPLVFSVGPLQGTRAPFGSKVVLTTKSPLTGIYLFTMASGNLGHYLARCGYLGVVITGRSHSPCFLCIEDQRVEFRPASHFWNASTLDTLSTISQEFALPADSAAVIGPAGVRGVRFANVITGGERVRAFGRGGAGAVMGSKRLKGIAIQGTEPVMVVDEQAFKEASRAIGRRVSGRRDWAQRRRQEGTTTSMGILQEFGMLPTRNWQQGAFEHFERIAPQAHGDQRAWCGESVPCAPFCPAPCARRYRVTQGEYMGTVSEGPDYETIYAFGSNCGIDRFDAIVAADRYCDEVGMDTISAGVVLSFAMECYERGLISERDLDGVALNFGDHRALLTMLRHIAERDGVGDLLAQGVKVCAQTIGRNSESFAMHAKGLELGGWGCRGTWGQALQYAVGSRGGCHHDLGLPAKTEYALPEAAAVSGKGELLLSTASDRIARDSAIICAFSAQYGGLDLVANLLAGIWGRPVTPETLTRAGERILNLERMLNVREGVNRDDDQLPTRLLKDPLPDGPRAGSTVPLEALKTEFYAAAGWDIDTGIPRPETLERLGIDTEALWLVGAGLTGR